MIKSPLRYPGGKSRALKQIMPLFPSDFSEYREPFLGGGSVFVHLRQARPELDFWVNDKYEALFWLWKSMQSQSEAVLKQIWAWRDEFPEGKKLHQFLKAEQDSFGEIKQAAAFFIFNRITFSGTSEAGGFSKQAFERRFTDSSIDRLSKIPALLTPNVHITNLDYEELLIKKVCTEGLTESKKEVFVFLDPPYYSATKSALYGKNGALHRDFDHHRLAEGLRNCPHRWLMTYDDSPFIRELYADFELRAWDLTYGMRNVTPKGDQLGKELFVSNYALK